MTAHSSVSDEALDRRLAACDPIDRVALDAVPVTDALRQLHESLVGPERRSRHWMPRTHGVRFGPSRARRRVVRLSLVAVVVIGVCLVGVSGLAGRLGVEHAPLAGLPALAVTPADAATLDRLARSTRAAAGNTVPLAPDQYQYVKELFSHASGGPYRGLYRLRSVIQTWWGFDGRSRVLTHYLPVLPLRGSDRAIVQAHRQALNHRLVSRKVTNDFYPAAEGRGEEKYFGRGLPSTPTGLFDALRALQAETNAGARGAPVTSAERRREMFNALGGILQGSLSTRQRAAAYIDLKYIHGVRLLGPRRDAIGRAGTAIQLTVSTASPYTHGHPTLTTQFIADPANGKLLQTATWSNQPCCGGEPGSAKTLEVYLTSAIVRSMSALPGEGHAPVRPGTTVR